jgi:hypothetical protein
MDEHGVKLRLNPSTVSSLLHDAVSQMEMMGREREVTLIAAADDHARKLGTTFGDASVSVSAAELTLLFDRPHIYQVCRSVGSLISISAVIYNRHFV